MALIKTGQDNESPVRIVETVVAVNDQRKRAMARKVAERLRRQSAGKIDRRARRRPSSPIPTTCATRRRFR